MKDDKLFLEKESVPVLELSCAYSSVDALLSDLNGEDTETEEKVQCANNSH